MKRNLMKFVIAFMALMAPLFQQYINAEELKIFIKNDVNCDNGDDIETELPKRSIANYTDCVGGVMDLQTKQLTLSFFVGYQAANINIYKDGNLLISRIYNVNPETFYTYDLSIYGNGTYQVVIVTNEDEDITGSFTIE